jgi:hypothetical protein
MRNHKAELRNALQQIKIKHMISADKVVRVAVAAERLAGEKPLSAEEKRLIAAARGLLAFLEVLD